MSDHKAVQSSLNLSMRIADILEQSAPQTYNGMNRAQTIRAVNDILQGRGERPLNDLLAELEWRGGYYAGEVAAVCRDIQDFRAQKGRLAQPYLHYSDKSYKFRTQEFDPDCPLKIVKETIDTRTRSQSRGRNGSSSTNYQQSGRELLTPDEVRTLDNRNAILLIRGEAPVIDAKYPLEKHPHIKLTEDGGARPYIHVPGLNYAQDDLSLPVDSLDDIEIIELEETP